MLISTYLGCAVHITLTRYRGSNLEAYSANTCGDNVRVKHKAQLALMEGYAGLVRTRTR